MDNSKHFLEITQLINNEVRIQTLESTPASHLALDSGLPPALDFSFHLCGVILFTHIHLRFSLPLCGP